MPRSALMQRYDQRITGDVERAKIHHTTEDASFTRGVVAVCPGKQNGETCHFQIRTATSRESNLGSKNVCQETFAGNSRWSTEDGTERFKNLPLDELRPNRQIIPFCKMNKQSSHEKAMTANATQTRSVRRFKTFMKWTSVTKWPIRLTMSNERWKVNLPSCLVGMTDTCRQLNMDLSIEN